MHRKDISVVLIRNVSRYIDARLRTENGAYSSSQWVVSSQNRCVKEIYAVKMVWESLKMKQRNGRRSRKVTQPRTNEKPIRANMLEVLVRQTREKTKQSRNERAANRKQRKQHSVVLFGRKYVLPKIIGTSNGKTENMPMSILRTKNQPTTNHMEQKLF